MDEAFRPGGASAAAIALPEATGTGDTGWKQLSTFEQTRKENVQQPGKWAGQHAHSLSNEVTAYGTLLLPQSKRSSFINFGLFSALGGN